MGRKEVALKTHDLRPLTSRLLQLLILLQVNVTLIRHSCVLKVQCVKYSGDPGVCAGVNGSIDLNRFENQVWKLERRQMFHLVQSRVRLQLLVVGVLDVHGGVSHLEDTAGE